MGSTCIASSEHGEHLLLPWTRGSRNDVHDVCKDVQLMKISLFALVGCLTTRAWTPTQ